MSTRPTRPVGSSSSASRSSHSSSSSSSAKPSAPVSSASNSHASAATSSANSNDRVASRDFTPMNIPNRPPSSGSSSARRVGYATSTASSILKGSDSDEGGEASDDDNKNNEEGRRAHFRQVMMQARAEAAEAAREAKEVHSSGVSTKAPSATDADDIDIARVPKSESTMFREPPATLLGVPDVTGPPSLPAQADEDNDLYYCPRLTASNLIRITGESDLMKVTKLSLHLNTEEQDLNELNKFLPSLTELNLIPPSFVSSLRDFGRSLTGIRKLSLPACGLSDLDGIENLSQLREFRAPNNIISDLSPLMFSGELRVLDLSNNKLKEKDMIEFVGQACLNLVSLFMEGNPIAMHKEYRSIVASRCEDIKHDFELDGIRITDAERQRKTEKDESIVDKQKVKDWNEKQDQVTSSTGGSSFNQAAYERKVAAADFNTLSSGVRMDSSAKQNKTATNSAVNSPTHARTQNEISPSAVSTSKPTPASPRSAARLAAQASSLAPAGAALPATSSSSTTGAGIGITGAAAAAKKKRDYERYLEERSSELNRGDPATLAARRRAEKASAVNDIMRLESEMNEDQAKGVAEMYLKNASKRHDVDERKEKETTKAAVPRLQFDAAYAANPSPTASPQIDPRDSGALSFNNQSIRAQQSLSLSTPRPNTGSGNRPGSASGNRPGTASMSRAPEDYPDEYATAVSDGASDLTYGSDAIMAGGYAQAMRARKKQASEHKGSDDSRSPSSSSRTLPSSASYQRRSESPSPVIRSNSVDKNDPQLQSRGQPTPAFATSNGQSGGVLFKAKPAANPSPPVSAAGTSGPRPMVAGGQSSNSMMSRHMAAGSPAMAARAVQAAQQANPFASTPASNEVVFVINKKTAPSSDPAAAVPISQPISVAQPRQQKTYTLVRGGSNKK